jgi:hypothetical protein
MLGCCRGLIALSPRENGYDFRVLHAAFLSAHDSRRIASGGCATANDGLVATVFILQCGSFRPHPQPPQMVRRRHGAGAH